MNMHVAFGILDIVYLILMHVGIVIFLYVLHKVTIWIAEMINKTTLTRKHVIQFCVRHGMNKLIFIYN